MDNIVTTYSDDSGNPPSVWRDYVNSNYPIFEETILVDAGAVFAGQVKRRIVQGQVAAVRVPRPALLSQKSEKFRLLSIICNRTY